jgi:predicted MFS family arabinose efflux permease
MAPALPWALLASAALATFAASSSGNIRAPFLIEMSRDLATGLGLIANLMALSAIAWGVASLIAGTWSDRIGRRPFLVGGPLALAGAMAGIALAGSYGWVAFWVTLAGLAAGSYTATVITEVTSRVENRQRGRALGWALSGQSMAMLLGVPLGALAGEAIGWRGVHLAVGAITFAAALALLLATTAAPAPRAGAAARRGGLGAALSPRLLRLLAMGVAERACYSLAVTFFAAFLQARYGLGLSGLALPLALFALGNILGTLLGGQLADRLPDRLATFAVAMAGTMVLALPLFLWSGGLAVSVLLGFGFILCSSVARPCLVAVLSNVPEEQRGTVLGLNVTGASIGWLGSAALGGALLSLFGFAAFAPLAAGFAACGAALAWRARVAG